MRGTDPFTASPLGPAFTNELEQVRAWLPRHRRPWLSSGEVAAEVGVTPRTVRNWCDRGLLHCEVMASGHRRIRARALDIFLAGGAIAEQARIEPTRQEAMADINRRMALASSHQEAMAILWGDRKRP